MGRPLSEATKNEAIRLRLMGVPEVVVSAKLGISQTTVNRVALAALRKEVVGLVDGGESIESIAERLSLRATTVEKIHAEESAKRPNTPPQSLSPKRRKKALKRKPQPAPEPEVAEEEDPEPIEIEPETEPEIEVELDDEKRLRGAYTRALKSAHQARDEGNFTAAAKFEKLASEYSDQLRKVTAKKSANEEVWSAPRSEVAQHTEAMREIVKKLADDFNRSGFVCDSCGRRIRTQIASDGEADS